MRIEPLSGCKHWNIWCRMDSLSPLLRWKSRQYSIWDNVSAFSSCCYDWTLSIEYGWKTFPNIAAHWENGEIFQNGPVLKHRTSAIIWGHIVQCCDEDSISISVDVNAAKPHVPMCFTIFGRTKLFIYDIHFQNVIKCGDCDFINGQFSIFSYVT